MLVMCIKKSKGCEWEGKLEHFHEHLKEECLFEESFCKHIGCSEKIIKKEKIKHEENCVFKLILCDFCEMEITVKEKENHLLKCLKMEIDCDNKCSMKV